MNYAKMISTVVLLGAMNMNAMNTWIIKTPIITSPNGKLTAMVACDGHILIYDAKTGNLIKQIGHGNVVGIDKFTDDNTIAAIVRHTEGIDADHQQEKETRENIAINDSCFVL